jgi:pescadillo
MTLDHLVKERYPSFVDAIRDLDDALSMLFLFSNLPSTTHVPAKTIAICQRLCLEFQHYVIVSQSLRKSFLSIKGIYYQATIQGQDVMWLVPYKFVQTMTGDIDFRIMITFVEFYTTLMGFVNYRLYTTIGLVYPPKFDAASDAQGGELGAFKLEGKGAPEAIEDKPNGHFELAAASSEVQAVANEISRLDGGNEDLVEEQEGDEAEADAIDKFQPVTTKDADDLIQPQATNGDSNSLFSKCTFYLSRETPKASLEFILKAYGCTRVGWDAVLGDGAFTTDESDSRITHQVVDRPRVSIQRDADDEEVSSHLTSQTRTPGRTYIQPQWIWDSINQGTLVRSDLYAPGASLPPHLSPWVKAREGAYDPTAPLPEQETGARVELEIEGVSDAEMDAEMEASEDEEADEVQVEEDEEEQMSDDDEKTDKKKEQEQIERQRMMLSNKKRKLFDKMQYGNKKRQAEADKLREKRRKIEKPAA